LSPDARKLAFTSGRDGNVGLFVVNADGSGLRRLVGSLGLSVVNADGSGERRLNRPAGLGWIAWSPDARKVAFVKERPRQVSRTYHSEIYVVNADGTGLRRLTSRGANPRWSPDGEKIAFRSSRAGKSELYVINSDGSDERQLTRVAQGGSWVQVDFAWSPEQKN
jgi:TolB protein